MENEKRIEWLKSEVKRLEGCIDMAEMADFLNWDAYRKMKAELSEVKKELERLVA